MHFRLVLKTYELTIDNKNTKILILDVSCITTANYEQFNKIITRLSKSETVKPENSRVFSLNNFTII